MDPKEQIYEALKAAGKAMKNKEVAEATGLDVKEVGKLMAALKKDGRVSPPKNCFYEAVL
ncbi:MAG: MarR family transcriptional regulator [Defluviitaleaceae bacterium]|nr:MarR family transcriptional regulator [Defluviitaleaceae bacterium]